MTEQGKADVTLPDGGTKGASIKANLATIIKGGCPFKEAEQTPDRVKAFMWGDSGTGKTTMALQFPSPAVIDMESGTRLYGKAYKFKRFPATEADEVMEAVDWLLNNNHPFRTLVIDPITIYWEALQAKYREIFLQRNKKSAGFKFEFYQFQPSDWLVIKAELKTLMRKLIRLDMNVVVIAREKSKYEEGEMMKKAGEVFDVERTMPYFFDVVLRMTRGPKGEFQSICTKERSPKGMKAVFPKGTPFELDYKMFEKIFGPQALKRESKKIQLVSAENKKRIGELIAKLGIPSDQVKRRLATYEATSLDDLTAEAAKTVLGNLESALKAREVGTNA